MTPEPLNPDELNDAVYVDPYDLPLDDEATHGN